jgi:hypothetical protein
MILSLPLNQSKSGGNDGRMGLITVDYQDVSVAAGTSSFQSRIKNTADWTVTDQGAASGGSGKTQQGKVAAIYADMYGAPFLTGSDA